jgi:molecular chaperone DnaJ
VKKDYFKILGIARSASSEQITKAYRRLAAMYHPDKHHGNPLADLAEEKFKEINEAYHALIGGDIELSPGRPYEEATRVQREEDIPRDAKELLYRGLQLYNQGKYKRAIQQFEQALTHTSSAAIHNLLGLAYAETGNYRMAVESLVEATRQDEENGKYHFDLGYAYYQLKKWEAAIQSLLDAYNFQRDTKRLAITCVYLAVCSYHLRKEARAEFFLEEAVNYDPDNRSYRILLDEFRSAMQDGRNPKVKILNRLQRFSFSTQLEDSIGNLFKGMFTR